MIIKSKPLTPFMFKFLAFWLEILIKLRFNKMVINKGDVVVKPGHSYILLCNHFSFWDGFWAFYLCNKMLWKKDGMQKLYIMSLKKQMEKQKWLQHVGSFSVEPRKVSMLESFDFAGEKLSEQGNLLLFYPQANLETSHIRHIFFEPGLMEIVNRIQGDCQLIWCSNITDYFESLKPSVTFNLMDCGTNHNFDFEALQKKVNAFHLKALARNVRYTEEKDKEPLNLS